jgi:hypothetical protein
MSSFIPMQYGSGDQRAYDALFFITIFRNGLSISAEMLWNLEGFLKFLCSLPVSA